MNETKRSCAEFSLNWKSIYAIHCDRYYFPRVNYWRDIFPGQFGDSLSEIAEGEERAESFDPGVLVPPYRKGNILSVKESQIRLPSGIQNIAALKTGRFYPRGIILQPNIHREDTIPFRYICRKDGVLTVDFNHPLAEVPIHVCAKIIKHLPSQVEHGGICNDIAYTIMEDGPGLQASPPGMETVFFHKTPFERADKSDDTGFYSKDRFVNHVDERAMGEIRKIYERLLKPGTRVLDLMSSWNSHLSEDLKDADITGLGLNPEEMKKNRGLRDFVLHDLNRKDRLPFEENEFDASICSLSVEYLVDPIRVFQEVGRVLKPGAPFVVTFSNRWFPPKVIALWTELNLFERIGLVLEAFRMSGRFEDLRSESIRNVPRPGDDKYFPEFRQSDPIFAVWGRARNKPSK
jgi:SAM-dependent methyltransferase